jgi:p-cumate 2,3-dioxygenase subunit beta
LSERLLRRLAVEELLYQEAALLDDWKLKEWLALYSPNARYEVAPTGDAEAGTLSSAESLFLVADDRERLEQRVIRLMKPQAHAEYPRSRVRHLYSNVRIIKDEGTRLEVNSNFVTFRTKRGFTATYMGWHRWVLVQGVEGFLIEFKRTVLDLDGLVPQGKVSLLL